MSFSRYLSKLGQLLNSSGQVLPSGLATGTDFTIAGLTVGKGGSYVGTNNAIGTNALVSNTTGDVNTAVGYAALNSNLGGSSNTAVGVQAMRYNTSGNNNVAIGRGSVYANTTGSYNVGVGQDALSSNTTASYNTAAGYFSLYSNTTGQFNTGLGNSALANNTTASNNTAVGYQAGYTNSTGAGNVFIGYQAGYTSNGTGSPNNTAIGYQTGYYLTTGADNTLVGDSAGKNLTTGSFNTFVGAGASNSAGTLVTTGAKNTIIGAYSGNQGGLDIRTANNYIVLSDGDGNPRIYNSSGSTTLTHNLSVGTGIVLTWSGDFYAYPCDAGSFNAAQAGIKIQKITSTNRSLNAAGTINASGLDYAEYMFKVSTDFTIAKGDVVGINSDGKLTNVFADAISFVVKSTDPSYVGGDTWGAKSTEKDGPQYTEEELEEQRQWVDRIAFSGQVPVNVLGATAGQYIVPVNDNGAIKGVAKNEADLTMSEYIKAVGKVIAIEQDGRAKIIVKVA